MHRNSYLWSSKDLHSWRGIWRLIYGSTLAESPLATGQETTGDFLCGNLLSTELQPCNFYERIICLQVTLIDKNERFVFKPLLYEIVNGTAKKEEVAPPFIKLLSPYAINFIQVSFQMLGSNDQALDEIQMNHAYIANQSQ